MVIEVEVDEEENDDDDDDDAFVQSRHSLVAT
jgi:hypothetical protein